MKAIEAAIRPASVEVLNGRLKPSQLSKMVERTNLIQASQQLLSLTYEHSDETLPDIVDEYLIQLPGGQDWLEDIARD